MDLRAEPIVISVPAVEKKRYYAVMLVDGNTFNYGYIGSRATGNDAGDYLVVGPRWKGETPAGIKKVFQASTDYSLAVFRTQLFNAPDMPNVIKVQDGYKAQPLSAYLKQPAPPAAPEVTWARFDKDLVKTEFFEFLDMALQFAPPGPEEEAIRAKLASIGIGPGKKFAFKDLSLEHKAAILIGMKEGDKKVTEKVATLGKSINGWNVSSAFGDRAFYKGDWLLRAAAARAGIYGNDAVEAMYPMTKVLADGTALDGSQAQVHADLPEGPVPAGQRVLVGHDVRRQDPAADPEPDQPLPDQLADAAGHEEERGWLAHALHPEGLAGQRQGSQLAAGARRPDLHGDAPVLAQDRGAVDPAGWRGQLAAAGSGAGELIAMPQGGRAAGRRSATIGA
jgi:hypothetical protein